MDDKEYNSQIIKFFAAIYTYFEVQRSTNSDLLVQYCLMVFTVSIWIFSFLNFIVAFLLYLPLLSKIRGNLKEYCCHVCSCPPYIFLENWQAYWWMSQEKVPKAPGGSKKRRTGKHWKEWRKVCSMDRRYEQFYQLIQLHKGCCDTTSWTFGCPYTAQYTSTSILPQPIPTKL